MRTIRVGEANVTIINLGDFNFKLKDVSDVPEGEWRSAGFSDIFENSKPYPSQCFLISLPRMSVLVDVGDYSKFAAEDPEHIGPGYIPPPSIVDSLSGLGVSARDVDYVVITHAHYDHYAGVTVGTGDAVTPTFPTARHLLGKQDFESPEMQSALRDPCSNDSRTFGVLLKSGLLELVELGRELSDEVEIIASPGETPGHKIVKLSSNGETLYCVGDLFHHAVEVLHPTWMAKWDDPKANLASRGYLISRALEEDALVAAAHMPVGRLESTGGSVRFVEEREG